MIFEVVVVIIIITIKLTKYPRYAVGAVEDEVNCSAGFENIDNICHQVV